MSGTGVKRHGGSGLAVGTAGWAIPRAEAAAFPAEGTQLRRYAEVLTVTEINSSFYKPHRQATYERWAASTPAGFWFAVKMPKAITHGQRLVQADQALGDFLAAAGGLGDKLAVVLVQLPPSLIFDPDVATPFFSDLQARLPSGANAVCEPRHPSWFCPAAEEALAAVAVARVGADPARAAGADEPGGWRQFRYRRLHGSPQLYRSAYGPERLAAVAEAMRAERESGVDTWCIFDNTVTGAAMADALQLRSLAGDCDC